MLPLRNAAAFIAAQAGVIPLTYGQPGTGKTRTWESFCKAIGRHFECLILGQHDPTEITGFPHVCDLDVSGVQLSKENSFKFSHTKALEYLIPGYRQRLMLAPQGGMLFLDEMGDAPPACQAAALQLLNDGIPNTIIAAAGNPPDCSTNAYELAPAAVNRLCVLDWESDHEEWCNGLIAGFPAPAFPILPVDWQKHIGEANGIITAYIRHRPTAFQALPPERSARSQPWPSKRSWTNAAKLIAAARSIGANEEVRSQLIAGCVGSGAAQEFLHWLTQLDLPDPRDLLKDPTKYRHANRGDKVFAILSSVVATAINIKSEEAWLAAWKVIELAAQEALDIAVVCCSPLSNNKPTPQTQMPLSMVKFVTTNLKGV